MLTNDGQRALLESSLLRLQDFKYFAETFFKIRTKNGSVIPFELNRAQLYIHDRLEAQLKETGKVRAIILKGRQQGVSTLIQARYFHKTITNRGIKTFILTHEAAATKNLFEMTKRYYEYLPQGLIPRANRDSQKELKFESIDSGYAIGTAGAKGTGRSQTVQLLHGCLGSGTRIYDPKTGGLKLIEDFIVGDRVQTHTGAIANISYISSQKKECLSVVFRGLTAFPLTATPEHRFWTKQGWKELRNLNIGDSVGYPVKTIHNVLTTELLPKATVRAHGGGRQFLCPDEINCNYEFGRLLGLYLADGHIALQYKSPHYPSRLEFAVHRKEVNRTIEWLLPFSNYYSSMKVNHREDSLTSTITIYGNRFIRLINCMCGRTKEKKFPFDWSLKGREFCLGLLHGYLAGDGSSYAEDRRIRATSICSSLTITLRDLCASLGFGWAGIEHKKSAVRHGRNEKEAYVFSLCGEGVNDIARSLGKPAPPILRIKTKSTKNNAANTTEISEGYAWVRIKGLKEIGEKVVYDFEVDHNDHSYCTIYGATHNSECAFWPNASEHAQGLMQAVGEQNNTEIILESTANGIGNYFHSVWTAAEQGKSDFQAIFVPWFWQPEYRAFYNQPNEEISLSEEEQNLMDIYSEAGLTREHIYWRRFKIGQFSNDHEQGVKLFNQEYPCIVGSQRVGTSRGLIPIQEVCVNDKTNTGNVINSWCSGEKETIQIKTHLGYTLECTLDHRLATEAGFIEAINSIGHDVILTKPNFSENYILISWNPMPTVKSTIIIDELWGLFLGFFMGNGSFGGETLSIAFNAEDTLSINKVHNLIYELFGLVSYSRKNSTNGIELRVSCKALKPIFLELGIIISGRNTKRNVCVPDCIWKSPKSVIKEFMRGIFDSDGFAGYEMARVSLFSKHEQFIKDLQVILLGFGITSKRVCGIRKHNIGKGPQEYMANELNLRGDESRKFYNEIGFVSERKIKRASAWIVKKISGRNPQPILFIDKVVSFDHKGMQLVYDLEIDNDKHVFDAQGILVHNCCANDSFLNPIDDTFIPSVHVSKARKVKIDIARTTPLYIGVDPAIGDNDRCAIIKRKGRVAYDLEFLRNHNTMELAGRLKTMIDKEKPAKVFIDCIGIGAGVVDRLQEMGYECVVGINVARTANNKERFGNLRAELWSEMRDWLMGEIPVQIPDSDELHTDLCGLGYKHRSNGQLLIESKDDLKKRGMPSPDAGDALAHTFAFGMYAGESNFSPNFMPDIHRSMFT